MAKKRQQKEPSLFDMALEAFGLIAEYVLAKREEKDRVTIVTRGGFKREYSDGAEIEPLTFTQKTGELK